MSFKFNHPQSCTISTLISISGSYPCQWPSCKTCSIHINSVTSLILSPTQLMVCMRGKTSNHFSTRTIHSLTKNSNNSSSCYSLLNLINPNRFRLKFHVLQNLCVTKYIINIKGKAGKVE